MKKYRVILHTAVCLLCALVLVISCDSSRKESPQPKVVRKKVSDAPGGQTAPSRAAEVKTGQTRPKKAKSAPAALQPKSITPRAESPLTTAKATDPSPSAAVIPAPQPVSKTTETTAQNALKKPAPTPKSDIADIGQPKPAPPQGAPSAKTTASTPPPYDRKGKIDPFEPLFKETVAEKGNQKKVKKREPKTPLERIALSQLKLVGIVTAPRGNMAMVEEASGKGYTIRKGTYIGINGGQVDRIEKEKVVISETYEDLSGKTETREVELTILKPPGVL
jgi:type IV pilus assembly protein PilP